MMIVDDELERISKEVIAIHFKIYQHLNGETAKPQEKKSG
jgi:hypothetical protein